jgi:hypothetical protein
VKRLALETRKKRQENGEMKSSMEKRSADADIFEDCGVVADWGVVVAEWGINCCGNSKAILEPNNGTPHA